MKNSILLRHTLVMASASALVSMAFAQSTPSAETPTTPQRAASSDNAPSNAPMGPGAGYGTSGASSADTGTAGTSQAERGSKSGDAADAAKLVQGSTAMVKQMESDPQVAKLLQQAKGVFFVPDYTRAGLGIGARAGQGVLLANNGGKWSSPVFYNLGGVSIGAQAGVETGKMAMILMSDKALNNFKQENKFSLNADAGLTIVNYTAKARASAGRGDVVVWSDTKGAFADVAVAVVDISRDDSENRAFYKSEVNANDIIAGKVTSKQASALTRELSSGQ